MHSSSERIQWIYLPISFPISETAVRIDVVCPDFEMIKHDLDLNILPVRNVLAGWFYLICKPADWGLQGISRCSSDHWDSSEGVAGN